MEGIVAPPVKVDRPVTPSVPLSDELPVTPSVPDNVVLPVTPRVPGTETLVLPTMFVDVVKVAICPLVGVPDDVTVPVPPAASHASVPELLYST